MAVVSHSLNQPLPESCREGAISFGNFDGVHVGHQALLRETIRQARELAGPAVAVTFDPPPYQLLRPDSFQSLLTPIGYRTELLHQVGVDHVVVMQTTPELLRISARDFFDGIVSAGFRARAIVEGFNFAFGKGREGTGDRLGRWGEAAGMRVTLLEAQLRDGMPVSSSRVRGLVMAGDAAGARELLGRPYRLFGQVGVGDRRGRTLGFPTANLTTLDNQAPGPGVYAAIAHHAGRTWTAAVHIGPRPTFAGASSTVEVHLLDFAGDLYGQRLAVDFLAKVRDPRSFASVDDLVRQIQIDLDAIRQMFTARPSPGDQN